MKRLMIAIAMTYEGTQCTRKPEEGKRYCKQHLGE